MKIILFDQEGNILKFAVEKVAYIDSKKDMYEVPEKTTAKPLKKYFSAKKMPFFVSQSILYRQLANLDNISSSDNSKEDLWSVSFVTHIKAPERNVLNYNFKLLAVGDLAFVSTALGKINMEGRWCLLCDLLSPKKWKTINHEAGEKMTFHTMQMIHTALLNK